MGGNFALVQSKFATVVFRLGESNSQQYLGARVARERGCQRGVPRAYNILFPGRGPFHVTSRLAAAAAVAIPTILLLAMGLEARRATAPVVATLAAGMAVPPPSIGCLRVGGSRQLLPQPPPPILQSVTDLLALHKAHLPLRRDQLQHPRTQLRTGMLVPPITPSFHPVDLTVQGLIN